MKFLVVFVLMNVLGLFALDIKAQHPVYRHFTVEEGLPSTEIYHIIQDSRGYIWIATNIGVSRFDGLEFHNFDKQDGLPENTVFEIYEDEKGRIWFISFPCQLSYFYEDKIHTYKYNDILRKKVGNYAIPIKFSFEISSGDEIRIGLLYDGLISIDYKGNLKKLHPTGGDSRSAHLFITDKKVLASQGQIMDLYNIVIHNGDDVIKYHFNNETNNFSHRQLMAIKNGNDQILFMQNDMLASFNTGEKPKVRFMDFRIFGLYPDLKGNIWVATDKNGAFCFPDGNILSKPIQHVLKDISISAVFQDNEGGLWFATLTEGLYYLSSDKFTSFSSSDGLTSNSINALAVGKHKIFIGTNDESVNILSNGGITNLKISDTRNDRIQALSIDSENNLWVGTNEYLYSMSNDLQVHKFHNSKYLLTKNKKFNKYSRNIFSLKTIINSVDSGLWIGESNSFSKFKDDKVIYNSLIVDSLALRTEAICQLDDGTVFIGALNGLWKYSTSGIVELSGANKLLNSRITEIKYFEKTKILLIGTKGSGLLVYHFNGSLFQINKSNGLSSNSVSSITIQGNHLWIGTNYGLNVLDINDIEEKDLKITSFYKINGLISNEINEIAADSKNIYIATNQGMTVFNYSDYKPLIVSPPVYISKLSIMKNDSLVKSGYSLNNDQNMLTFEFIGISFRDAGNLSYKYRLMGLGNDWNYTRNTKVEYAFLPPGDFTFEVVAINSEGNESSLPAQLSFSILPPFYKTWWFILLSILCLITIGFTYYKIRLKKIRQEHALRNDMNWLRQQALAKQMDPHFVFNTLNSIQSYIIKNDRLSSSQYLSKFSRLMRIILINSQKHAIPLSDEISALTLYLELESLRFQQKFKYHLIVDPSIDSSACFIPAFFVQPIVENAIWHGIAGLKKEGCIKIFLNKGNKQITCIVEDNGIGRVKSKEMKTGIQREKKSFGIELVRSRLSLLNDLYGIEMKVEFIDLYGENGVSEGTRVIINLPLIS